jgi:hypothetical protein
VKQIAGEAFVVSIDPFSQLSDAAERFASLARRIEPEALDVMASEERSVRETVTHVHEQFRLVAGVDARGDNDDLNGRITDIPRLALTIRGAVTPLFKDFGSSIYGAAAIPIGETVVHGDQIACAVRDAGWSATHDDVMVFWRYGLPVLQGLLRADATDVNETWELQFQNEPTPVVFSIADGVVSESLPDGLAPVGARHVVAIDDAVAFTLEFPVQRRPATDPDHELLMSHFNKP